MHLSLPPQRFEMSQEEVYQGLSMPDPFQTSCQLKGQRNANNESEQKHLYLLFETSDFNQIFLFIDKLLFCLQNLVNIFLTAFLSQVTVFLSMYNKNHKTLLKHLNIK